jgi:ribosomal protein S18 acetylase RimI-like enzyme
VSQGTKRARTVEVAELELEDLPAVFALGEKLFRADSWPALYRTWDEFELVSFYGSDYDTCLGAHTDDGLVGFILGTVLEKRRSAWRYGWVVWLGVDPRLARSGIAQRLLDQLTNRFIDLGCRMLLADTDPSNMPAVSFFQREGFGAPREHIYLEKNLSKDPRYAPRLERQRSQGQSPPGRKTAPTKEGRRPTPKKRR